MLFLFCFLVKSLAFAEHFEENDIRLVAETIVKTKWQELKFLKFAPNPFGFEHALQMGDEFQLSNLEWAPYHEMIVHYAVAYLPKFELKRALLVGAGDGLTLKEVVKHHSLERVDVLELDEAVPSLCNQHYGIDMNMNNSKVKWVFGDASQTIDSDAVSPEPYDLIIVDTSEDLDTNTPVDEMAFLYNKLSSKLAPHGVMVKNGAPLLPILTQAWKHTFGYDYFTYTWPNPGNKYTFVLCSDHIDFTRYAIDLPAWKTATSSLQLEFYRPSNHYHYARDWKAFLTNGPDLLGNDADRPLHFGFDVLASGRTNIESDLEVVKYHDNVFGFDKGVHYKRKLQRGSVDPAPFHEMLVHYPVAFLPNHHLERVLIIGGGDGLALNEVLKWNPISAVDVQDPDEIYNKVCEKHIGTNMHRDDPRVNWHFGPTASYLLNASETRKRYYDLIIGDKNNDEYLLSISSRMSNMLTQNGIVVVDWNERLLGSLVDGAEKKALRRTWKKNVFHYAFNSPVCPAKRTCYLLMLSRNVDLNEIVIDTGKFKLLAPGMKYYNISVHHNYARDWRAFLVEEHTPVFIDYYNQTAAANRSSVNEDFALNADGERAIGPGAAKTEL